MIKLSKIGKFLKEDPVSSLAATKGIEGFKIRTEILKSDIKEDECFANRQISSILLGQEKNGSWNNTIIETAGNVNLLLDYGCPSEHPKIEKAKAWMLSRQILRHPYYQGLFVEKEETNYLRKKYVKFEPLLTPVDFDCCIPHTTIATSSVLEAFFKTGEDIPSNDKLALAVDRIIALGNMVHGICAGNIGQGMKRKRKVEAGHKLWIKSNNVIFRRSSEENPGIPICAHIFLRAISYSQKLLHSAYVKNAIDAWKKHQLENGNFETNYYRYNFYYAIDTLRLFRKLLDVNEMFRKMIPAILRRQRKDGLWRRKGDWLAPTFSVVYALYQFGYL